MITFWNRKEVFAGYDIGQLAASAIPCPPSAYATYFDPSTTAHRTEVSLPQAEETL